MYNVYRYLFSSKVNVLCSTVIENVLYYVISEGKDYKSIKLIWFDIFRMVEIATNVVEFKHHINSEFIIMGDKLYCRTRDNLSVIDINNFKIKKYTIKDLRNIIDLNGRLCYISYDDYRIFGIYDLETKGIYYTIKVCSEVNRFENNVLYIRNCVDFDSQLPHYSNHLIIMDDDNIFIDVDFTKRKITTSEKFVCFKHYKFIGNNKLFLERGNSLKDTIYDYKNDILSKPYEYFSISFENSFRYMENDYYININFNSVVDKTTLDVYIDLKFVEYEMPKDMGYPEYVTVGSERNNIKVPTSLLYENSEYFQYLIKTFGATEYIKDEYENIQIYIEYLNERTINLRTLDEYKIASLFDDFNMEILVYIIIETLVSEHDKIGNKYDIRILWNILETIYYDDMMNVFKILLYLIYKNYDRGIFLYMLNDVTPMNNAIITDIIGARYIK